MNNFRLTNNDSNVFIMNSKCKSKCKCNQNVSLHNYLFDSFSGTTNKQKYGLIIGLTSD